MAKAAKIFIVNNASYRSSRDNLRGIFEYIDEFGPEWDLHMIQSSLETSILETALRNGSKEVAGIILEEMLEPAMMDVIAESDVPLAVVGIRHEKLEARARSTVFIRNDNKKIGQLAASHFLSLANFNSYVFFPAYSAEHNSWAGERQSGFVETLKKAGISVMVPPAGADAAKWLSELPKPTAVLAAYDPVAADVLHACCDNGLNIPKSVAIMGVDNDDIICGLCRPKLTSILPGHREMGYVAARELHRLMTGKSTRRRRRIFIIPPKGVIERDSTKNLPPSTALVNRICDFIRKNACRGIAVSDVVRHAHVSRRLAELRFREIRGTSLRAEIESHKLGAARRLLANGTHTVASAARLCGFKSANRLTRVFKNRYGVSIREWQDEGDQAP